MQTLLLQENPATILGDIALKLSEHYQLTVAQTKPDVAPEELAKQALKEKADIIIASGGDGTVGAVAGALVGTGECQLALAGCPCMQRCQAMWLTHVPSWSGGSLAQQLLASYNHAALHG
jgi:diacylglycerol kinase family enzyme